MQSYNFTRSVPVEEGYDVLVAGGGPAGSAAAVCAARLGAKVLLVEATGSLGGMSTSGLVNTFGPMGDGERTLVGGFTRELIETMHERGYLGPEVTPEYWITHYNRWIPFDPEALKRLLDEYCVAAGVEIRYFTRVIDADVRPDGQRRDHQQHRRASVHHGEDLHRLHRRCRARRRLRRRMQGRGARLAVPAGDSVLDLRRHQLGRSRPTTPTAAPMRSARRSRKNILPQANAEGHFTHPDHFIAGMKKVGYVTGNLNAGHIYGLDGLNVKSLSEGMISGRKVAVEYMEFYRKYVPGCEHIELAATSPVMGVRDTRRIVGEFELTAEHYSAARQFPDQVAVYNRPADVHSTNGRKKSSSVS